MNDRTSQADFVSRFERTRSAIRRAAAWQGICWAISAAAFGLGAMAAADYWFELPWIARAVGLSGFGCLAAIVAVVGILWPLRRWSRSRTALQMERRFPKLGQRIRTVVQFSGRTDAEVASEGVAPSLVAALEGETDLQTQPLDLATIGPGHPKAAVVAAVLPMLLLLGGLLLHWESRLAIRRALLAQRSYTELAVAPGNVSIDFRSDATLSLELTGRVDRSVALYTRTTDAADAPWNKQTLSPEVARSAGPYAVVYETKLQDLQKSTEYRVAAGPAESDVYRITLRYPPAIEKFEAALTPPAYTGVEPSTVEGGDLDVIEGTTVNFRVKLTQPCREAFLVLSGPPDGDEDGKADPRPRRVAMNVDGTALSAELKFRRHTAYTIAAVGHDGLRLEESRYDVRIRKDRPPRVRFQSPDEELEVHSLAEVLMRVHADDDFGLTKAGIVLQVDDGRELTLLAEDFAKSAAGEAPADARSGTTRATLEKALLLEDHELTPTQAMTYYAFAEDNFPGGPRRTATDLRFIDIRPFKRIYKVGGM